MRPMKASTILQRAQKLIDSPSKWVQKKFADGGRFCAVEACNRVAPEQDRPTARSVWSPLLGGRSAALGGLGIMHFNDAPDTTHADVMMLFDFAILAAKDEERASK